MVVTRSLTDLRRPRAVIAWSLALVLFLGLALLRLQQPVSDDEIYEVRNAERLIAGEPIHQYIPPVYDLALAGVMYLAGDSDPALRLPGLLCAAITLGLTLGLTRQLGLSASERVICLVLLATSPAFVQGALLVHIDNTLLVPACLLFVQAILCWWGSSPGHRVGAGVLSSIALAVALLVKFSAPLLMVAGLGLALLWRDRPRLIGYSLIVAGGLAGFWLLWFGLAQWLDLDMLQPFRFVIERSARQRGTWLSWLVTWARNGATLIVWFMPWLLAGCLWGWRRPHRLSTPYVLLGAAALAIFIYLPLTSINHGFPKYFLPALPLLVVFFVHAVSVGGPDRPILWMTLGTGLFLVLAGFEPVYFLRYELRRLLVNGQDPTWQVLRQVAIGLAPALALIWWRQSRSMQADSMGGGLLALCLATGLAISVQQSLAPYQTNYSYGEVGTRSVVAHLQGELGVEDRVISTQDILYRLGRHHQALPDSVWGSPTTLVKLIEAPATRFVVVSLPSQAQATMISLDHQPLATALSRFDTLQIGTHLIYERR